MTAAPEIPADVMAAAREAARSSVERPYNKGTVSRASAVIARAILAERRRCVEAVNAERLFQDGESPFDADPTDISYDLAICHAADAIKRLSR